MKIEFEIEERIPEIVTEILYSGKWHSIITDDCKSLKRAVIKNFIHDIVAFVEIWEREIHIKTACSNSTYRIFCRNGHVMCEYIGACCQLLDEQVFPQLTPLRNIHHYILDKENPEPLSEQYELEDMADNLKPAGPPDEFIHESRPVPYIRKIVNIDLQWMAHEPL
jgi:hypothetical protein